MMIIIIVIITLEFPLSVDSIDFSDSGTSK